MSGATDKKELVQLGDEPDWRQIFQTKHQDGRIAVPKELITSDQNNETKTRIPEPGAAVLAMTYLDLMAKRARGDVTTLDGLLNYTANSGGFGDRQRINWISQGGGSRKEFVATAIASVLGRVSEYLGLNRERFEEGSKKGS